jgi:hypothetical protein
MWFNPTDCTGYVSDFVSDVDTHVVRYTLGKLRPAIFDFKTVLAGVFTRDQGIG